MPQRNAASTAGDIQIAYEKRVSAGELEADDAQLLAVRELDALAEALEQVRSSRTGLLSWFCKSKPEMPKGLYLHGGVGRGKTMLMDLFYETVAFKPAIRQHFHEFMSATHDRIIEARRKSEGDPIPFVANEIAPEPTLLCFDEFHVTDIADAMILGRLFRALFANGTVLVSTSNAAPQELYRNGLNRQLFLPVIDLLEDHVEVLQLEAAKDYRLDKLVGRPLYFSPVDEEARREMDQHWQRLSGTEAEAKPEQLEVLGRQIDVPLASRGVARFSFSDLCEKPLGARDYVLIAHTYHTVMIDGIPRLPPDKRNEARRFINLIDALYDNRVGLIASAEAEPAELYPAGDESDLFARTESRLMEMRTPDYLAQRGKRGTGKKQLLRS